MRDEPAEALLVKGGPGQVGQERRGEERRGGDRTGQVKPAQVRTGERAKLTYWTTPIYSISGNGRQQEAAERAGAGAGVGTMSREMISSIQCQYNQAINAIRCCCGC
jgi:hypothetical protein